MDLHNRKLLQAEDALRTLSPAITFSPDPLLHPMNGTSPTLKRPFKPNTPFDSSMALTILVLLTALFFMGFFSIYIRRFADDNPVDISRRRRHPNASPPAASSSSSTAPTPWMANPCKGLDSSAIRSLPFISYCRDPKHQIIDCAICLSEFQDSETVKLIPYCRHVFHPRCIDTWLSSHGSCPLCRCTQLFTADEESGLYVIHEEVGHGASRWETRSTVDVDNTCVLDESDVRTPSMRRTSSCSSIGDRATLPRTSSI